MSITDINESTFLTLDPEVQKTLLDSATNPDYSLAMLLVFWGVMAWIFFR